MRITRHGTQNAVKYVYHTGTSASSTARVGTSCEKEQRRIRNSFNTQWISFQFLTTISRKGAPQAPLREEARGQRVLHRQFSEEEVHTKYYLGIHDRFIRDEKFRKNMIDNGRTEEICRQMDDLATKTTLTI